MFNSVHQSRIHDLHRSVTHYFADLTFSRLGCCDGFMFIIYFIFFLPWFAATFAFSLALATLIPLGFIFGLLEHKTVFLWTLIVIFIQMGGILDLFADLALIADYFFPLCRWIRN